MQVLARVVAGQFARPWTHRAVEGSRRAAGWIDRGVIPIVVFQALAAAA